MAPKSRLVVLVDGKALPDDEARALWKQFSEHMEATRGDTGAFAQSHGFASVLPEYRKGQAVLVVKR
jgi:hypothetical protein